MTEAHGRFSYVNAVPPHRAEHQRQRFLPLAIAVSPIERRIPAIEVLRIHVVLCDPQCFTEPLVMHQFPFPEKMERFAHIPVVDQPQQVVVGHTSLLLCCNFPSTLYFRNSSEFLSVLLLCAEFSCLRIYSQLRHLPFHGSDDPNSCIVLSFPDDYPL